MTQVKERVTLDRPMRYRPAAQAAPGTGRDATRGATIVRVLGALSLLAMGVVHLEQFFAVHYRVVPTIGPLFALNFVGAATIAVALVLPLGRRRTLGSLLALGGIAMAVTSIVFLLVSEQRRLFGFMEYGYRPAIIAALAAEAIATVCLAWYVALLRR